MVLVSSEFRFLRRPDGSAWTPTLFGHGFWQRYREVFDEVGILARAAAAGPADPDLQRVDGPGVKLAALPCYRGPVQFALAQGRLRAAARAALPAEAAVIFRVASPIADLLLPVMARQGRPFGLEIVGDPWDTFAPGAVRHPLRPLLRRWFARRLRAQCRAATATAYVTERSLQRRYPPAAERFTTSYSSIELPAAAFAAAPRPAPAGDGPLRLLGVGMVDQMYKGFDVLLQAAALCRRAGRDLRLTLVGGGVYLEHLRRLAGELELGEAVVFRGLLPAGEAVRRELDGADLFVVPSRQEGLPRALIEAMARGLPCLGSDVGGIPELLPPECLLPPGDAAALARAIMDLADRPRDLAALAARNLETARRYRDDVLVARRREFYGRVRAATERWLSGEAP